MALPVNVGKGTVIGTFVDSSGIAATGQITFTPSPARLLDATSSPPTTILPKTVTANLVAGAFSVDLLATNDPDVNPSGFTYLVAFQLSGVTVPSFSISVPEGVTVDLATVSPIPSANGDNVYPDVNALQADVDTKADRAFAKRTVTGSTTLVAGDANDIVLHVTASGALTITLPQDSAATIAQEISIPWRQYGAGQITFAAGTGATLVSRGGATKSFAQYAEGTVTKSAANTWILSGDITT